LRTRRTITLVGLCAIVAGVLSVSALPAAAKASVATLVAKDQIRAARLPIGVAASGLRSQATTQAFRTLPTLSGSFVASAKDAFSNDAAGVAGDTGAPAGSAGKPAAPGSEPRASGNGGGAGNALGAAAKSLGCSVRNADGNVRVNQDCTFRRQAEEGIAVNPANPSNLIAGQNDSRIGFNHCGFDYSFDGGKTWGDGQPPYWQRLNNPDSNGIHTVLGDPGTNHTYDFASDPGVAFDSQGRAFYSCVVIDLFSNAGGLLVPASPIGAGGAFYNNVSSGGSRYVVSEDNNAAASYDKPFITADTNPGSPNRDNVYATWSIFKFDPSCGPQPNPAGDLRYCSSTIYGSMSTNHAVTWSKPEEISGSSSTLCFFGNFFDPTRSANACTFDQGSDPSALPNGDLEVIFNNGNTPAGNPNSQQLGVHCHPTGDSATGTAQLNCASPTKVGDDIVVGEPACNFGRGPEECIPGAYIRTNDYPRIAQNHGNGNLYATWQDYRSGQFDIQLAQSTDGGNTWTTATAPVNPDQNKDHYFAAIDVVSSSGNGGEDRSSGANEGNGNAGDHVAVSYYRTNRVPGENGAPACPVSPTAPPGSICFAPGQPGVQQEASDYTLAGGFGLNTAYAAAPVSPSFAPPDGIQAGFNGDYSGLAVAGNVAHPVWSDTRNTVPAQFNSPTSQGVVHDEDIFTTARPVPSKQGD
jgi:hypothetical protein